jgi:hypothetical protein
MLGSVLGRTLIVSLVALFLTGCGDETNIEAAKKIISAKLRDPSSAQFSSIKVLNVNRKDAEKSGLMTAAIPSRLEKWTCVMGLVNSKNGFGGYAGNSLFAVIVETNTGMLDREAESFIKFFCGISQ